MQAAPKFIGKEKALFLPTLKKRVDQYFKDNQLSKNANAEMYFKTVFFGGGTILLYALIIGNFFSAPVVLALAATLGAFKAFIGFNISHDAIHGSYSTNRKLNNFLGVSFNLIGGNDYLWSIMHNVVHHTYTNIPGHDEDIEVAPGMIRISPEEKLRPHMRYQHIYAFLLYCLASISWVFRKDYIKFFKKNIGPYEHNHGGSKQYIRLFGYKLFYYIMFIVVPLVVLPYAWYEFLLGFFVMHVAMGMVLGLVFQLAHVVEGTDFPVPQADGKIEAGWADHQMYTTANFAITNPVADFLCGGLNFQVEHHLFPNICHVHYKRLSPIVRQTAAEFGLPYIENKTFTDALVSHYRTLRRLGKEALEQQNKAALQPA